MARLTAQEAAEKWSRRTTAATADMQKGVERVTVAPGQAAAAKADKYAAGIQEAIATGKWRRRVAATTLEDWKSAMISKGVQRVSSGVTAAGGKVASYYQWEFPVLDNLRSQLNQMPDVTLEDSIQRAVTQMRGMAEAAKRR